MNTRTKLIGTIALGAALLVPVAQAESPDDRAGLRGPGGIAALQKAATSSHPDNRAVRATTQKTYVDTSTGVLKTTTVKVGPGAATAVDSQIAMRPDDRAGVRGPGAYRPSAPSATSHPDNRAGTRGPGSVETVAVTSAPVKLDAYPASSVLIAKALENPVSVPGNDEPASTGFDWGDAMIGGLGGVGMALLLTGCFFLLASQRNKARLA